MHIDTNLIITSDNAAQYAGVTHVDGSLYIDTDAQLPVLTSVGGKPYTQARATARATSPRRPA